MLPCDQPHCKQNAKALLRREYGGLPWGWRPRTPLRCGGQKGIRKSRSDWPLAEKKTVLRLPMCLATPAACLPMSLLNSCTLTRSFRIFSRNCRPIHSLAHWPNTNWSAPSRSNPDLNPHRIVQPIVIWRGKRCRCSICRPDRHSVPLPQSCTLPESSNLYSLCKSDSLSVAVGIKEGTSTCLRLEARRLRIGASDSCCGAFPYAWNPSAPCVAFYSVLNA